MRFLDVQVVTPAPILPVTAPEFIDHARLNGLTVDREPELLARQLQAATEKAEGWLRRSLMEQTLKALYVPDGKDCRCTLLMMLPRGPVKSVQSIMLTRDDSIVDPAAYRLEWNTIVLQAPLAGAAAVEFVSAGYGTAGAKVPAAIREGILEYATTLYEDRTGARESKYQSPADRTIPRGVQDLWRPYQIEVSG